MAIQDVVLNTVLPHFEAQQKQGQDGRCHLSIEARVLELKKQLASLELGEAVEKMSLNDSSSSSSSSELEQAIGELLVQFVNATVAAETTSDLQESVDRVNALIAAFGITYTTEVATMIMERAIEFSTVLLERVRGHACILLGKIAKTLIEMKGSKNVEDEDWVDENLAMILDAIVPRLQDKSQAVRCHAITAAGTFFAALEEEDTEAYEDILDGLLWSVAHDPSVSNRIAGVQSVPVTTQTLDVIISRVRDVKPKVRAQALQVLSSKAEFFTKMTEQQIVHLIQSGFTDRCTATKEAASKMVCTGWMKAVKYDPIALLKMIGVMDNDHEASLALQVVFEAAREEKSELIEDLSDPEIRAFKSGIEEATVPLQNADVTISPEQLFYLRSRCQSVIDSRQLSASQKDSITNKLIPDIPILCEAFENHTTELMKAIESGVEEKQDIESFICLQLLQFAKIADLKEEGSRRHFSYVMKQMLSSVQTPDDLVESCIQALNLTCDNEAEFIECVSEITTTISNKTNLNQNDSNYSDDKGTLDTLRILSILAVLLETATSHLSTHPAVNEFAKYIVPSVAHSDALVREVAVGCFGKIGLFTEEGTILNEFIPILLAVASQTDEKMEIRAQALLALSDWSMLFSDVSKPCAIGDKTISFSDIVNDVMCDSRTAAVCIGAEVAAKLLISGRVCDSSWLAQLLAIFFDPRMVDLMEEDDDVKEVGSAVRLQQLLTVFFPAYSMKSDLGRDALMGSILPMLDIIYFQPQKRSPKGKKTPKKTIAWPVAKMIQYVCSMVETGKPSLSVDATVDQAEKNDTNDDTEVATIRTSIAGTESAPCNSTSLLASVQIADFLAKRGQDLNVTTLRALCKILGSSEFDTQQEEYASLVALKGDMEELGMLITDASALRSLSALNDLLSEIEADDDNLEEDEELDDEEEEDEPKTVTEVGDDSDKTESEGEDEENADDIDDPVNSMNLSDDLVVALKNVKITNDDECALEKENNGKRISKGRKNSSGSAASRRSRLKRLSDISAN